MIGSTQTGASFPWSTTSQDPTLPMTNDTTAMTRNLGVDRVVWSENVQRLCPQYEIGREIRNPHVFAARPEMPKCVAAT